MMITPGFIEETQAQYLCRVVCGLPGRSVTLDVDDIPITLTVQAVVMAVRAFGLSWDPPDVDAAHELTSNLVRASRLLVRHRLGPDSNFSGAVALFTKRSDLLAELSAARRLGADD